MATILDRIVATKKEEVARLRRQGVRPPAEPVAPPRGFVRALTEGSDLAIIGEIKRASPSKGLISSDFEPVAIARAYLDGGARAISVLTDADYFQGDLAFIPQVRGEVPLPVLRKDFIIHELQITEARAHGADAVLLIAAILDDAALRDLLAVAEACGLDVLLEVHDEWELERAMVAGARLLGINNRNLKDFTVDLATSLRLKRLLPEAIPVVSESGIRSRDDLRRLADAGIRAALIGETLMRAADRAQALRSLLGAV
ncbi:MAG: indole-3-glycerol phosphate synthase TrpC [Thermodesulfobacteriota bacterium]